MITKRPPAPSLTYAQWRARKAERLAIGTAPSLSKDEVAKRAEAHESNYRRPAFRMDRPMSLDATPVHRFPCPLQKPDDFDVLTNGYTEEMLSDRISFKVPMQ
jgi:hypothetical protein